MCQAGFGGVDPEAGEYYCFYETFAGGYGGAARERRPGRGADARAEHRERAGRGDRAELPGADRRARARRELRGPRPVPRRARPAQGLPVRPARRRSRSSPTATARARGASSAATPARVAEYVHIRDGVETTLGVEDDARPRARRRDQLPHLRRRRVRPARGARPGARPPRRAARARSAPSAPASIYRVAIDRSTGRSTSRDGERGAARDERPAGDRHRRHVHGCDADRRGDGRASRSRRC